MIRYSLRCDRGHDFDAWFSSGAEYDRLNSAGHVACAVCGSVTVEKQLMAPSVSTSRRKEAARAAERPEAAMPAAGQPSPMMQQLASVPDEVRREFLRQMRELKKHVLENAEDVGDRFGEEARKIHYGESEKRGIYGKATLEEAEELWEEGIEFAPLPDLPEERN